MKCEVNIMNIPLGRENIARLFENSIKNDRLSQAYIITGEKGMGKKTVARYIASLILCESHTACGKCPSCMSMQKGSHPDLVFLKRDEDKASLGVENVRAVKTEVYTRPAMSDYKVILVEEMHLATTQAQNSMLKMIEEPPERVVFLMLANTMSPILPTIASRSVITELSPLGTDVLKRISPDSDYEIGMCGGNPGRLLKLSGDEDYREMRDTVSDAFFGALSAEPYAPYESASVLDKIKSDKEEIFSVMLSLSRDIYMQKTGLEIINKDKANYINTISAKLNERGAYNIWNEIIKEQKERGKNGNFMMAVTLLLLRCRKEIIK